MGRGRRRKRIRCVGSAGDGGWFSASSGDDGRELPCRSGELQGQMKMIWDIDSPTQERTEFPMSSPWVFFFLPWFPLVVNWDLWGISFLSAEDNNACYVICEKEEPQEAPISPPRCEPGKEGGLSALICRLSDVWIQSWIARPWFPPHVGVVVESLSCLQLYVTPWTAASQASLSFTISWSLLKLVSIESAMPSNHLVLCCSKSVLKSLFFLHNLYACLHLRLNIMILTPVHLLFPIKNKRYIFI